MDGDADFKILLDKLADYFATYLEVDQYLFHQKLGQQTDYGPLLTQIDTASVGLQRLGDELETYIDDDDVTVTRTYIGRLGQAVTGLQVLAEKLARQAMGEKKYSFLAYRRDLKAYRQAVKGYNEAGGAMNDVMQKYAG